MLDELFGGGIHILCQDDAKQASLEATLHDGISNSYSKSENIVLARDLFRLRVPIQDLPFAFSSNDRVRICAQYCIYCTYSISERFEVVVVVLIKKLTKRTPCHSQIESAAIFALYVFWLRLILPVEHGLSLT